MGFATHLGGWLLGTIKEGANVNTGGTLSVQYVTLTAPAQTATLNLPAGTMIEDIVADVTTAFDGTTPLISVGVTGTLGLFASGVATAAGRARPTFTAAQLTAMRNIGTADVPVVVSNSAANSTAGSVTVKITYVVRDAAGNLRPTSA